MASGSESAELLRRASALFAGGVVAGMSDGELLERFASRGGCDDAAAEAAFGAIVERHGRMVLGVCRRALRDPRDAEDAFQATFLVLARKADAVRVDDSLGRWLYGVSRRVATKARSRSARRLAREATGSIEPDAIGVEAPDLVERAEIRDVVLEELARLPAPFREAVALCDLEGCTQDEAARRLGWPAGTVRSRLSRGRARLRDRLSRRGLATPALLPIVDRPTTSLLAQTTRSAVRFATRGAPAGAFPAGAAALAEGVLLAMFLTKLKLAATCAAVAVAALVTARTIASGPDRPDAPPVSLAVAPPDQPEAKPPGPLAEPTRAVSDVPTVPKSGTPLESRPAFEVLVIDERTERPIPKATVRAFLSPGEQWVTTDGEGIARGLRPSSARYEVVIDAWADGYQSRRARWSNEAGSRYEPLDDRVTIALAPGERTVGGRVVDEAGAPIPGVTVELSGMREGQTFLAFFDLSARTDAEGRWSSRSMPEDLSKLGVQFYHPDYLRPVIYTNEVDTILNLDELKVGTHVMTLERGARVEGRVLDADGNPVAGATLKLPALRGISSEPEAATDADGRFIFPAAFKTPKQDRTSGRGSYSLLTAADGFAPDLRTITARADMGPLEIRLEPGRTIRGRAIDTSGNPVPDAWLIPRTWRNRAFGGFHVGTDAEGRFSWDSAPPDAITLDLSAGGYQADSIVCTPGETEYTWTLTPTLSAELRVADARTGEPVKRFELVRGRVGEDGEVAWQEPQDPRDRNTELYGRGYATLDASAPGWKLRVTAQGYQPLETRTISRDEGRVRLELELEPLDFGEGGGPSGVVVDTDGKPLQGAEVMLATRSQGASLNGMSWWSGQGTLSWSGAGTIVADDQGRFTFSPTDEPYALGVVHETGYGEATRDEFERTGRVVVRPWGRVAGRVLVGDEPQAGARISISDDTPISQLVTLNMGDSTVTDAAGRFVFERVKPGSMEASTRGTGISHYTAYFDSVPGETVEVTLGGTGRPVVGRLRIPERLEPNRPIVDAAAVSISNSPDGNVLYRIPYPEDQTHEEQVAWLAEWWWSPEGIATRQGAITRTGTVGPDGAFRVPDVPPGEYTVRVTINGIEDGRTEPAARAEHRFVLGPIPGGRSDEPIDVGIIKLEPVPEEPEPAETLDVGERAPDFDAETIDGEPLKLADYRGKFVLLDFWATWCGPCIEEFPHLKAAADAIAADGRGVLISLSLDDDRRTVADFLDARDDHPDGIQGFLGPWSGNAVADAYGVTAIPAIILVGPDGTVLASGLRGDAILATLRGVLARR